MFIKNQDKNINSMEHVVQWIHISLTFYDKVLEKNRQQLQETMNGLLGNTFQDTFLCKYRKEEPI